MENPADILTIYAAALGQPLVAHILNVGNPDDLAALLAGPSQLQPGQQATVNLLQQMLTSPLLTGTSESSREEVLRAILTQQDDRGITLARHLHLQSGGSKMVAAGADEV